MSSEKKTLLRVLRYEYIHMLFPRLMCAEGSELLENLASPVMCELCVGSVAVRGPTPPGLYLFRGDLVRVGRQGQRDSSAEGVPEDAPVWYMLT